MTWKLENLTEDNICTYCTSVNIHDQSKLLAEDLNQIRASQIEQIILNASKDQKRCIVIETKDKRYSICIRHFLKMLELMDKYVSDLP